MDHSMCHGHLTGDTFLDQSEVEDLMKKEGGTHVSAGSYPGTFATTLLHSAAVMVPPGQDCALCSVRCGNHPRTVGRNTF